MFARLRSPRLGTLRVSWPAQSSAAWTSLLPDAVFDGDTVNLFALLAGDAQGGEVRLFGRDGDQPEQQIACAVIGPASMQGQALARVAAYARAESPVHPRQACADGDALQIALDYQLVTQRTNFLLLHERAAHDKAADMPVLRQVAPMVPAGFGGTGMIAAPIQCAQPAMWRRTSTSDMFNELEAAWDIPAFLRRADSPQRPDRDLTPLGLHQLLRSTPRHCGTAATKACA